MPIGIPEEIKDIRPESIARRFLKGKTSSIFNTSCRKLYMLKIIQGK